MWSAWDKIFQNILLSTWLLELIFNSGCIGICHLPCHSRALMMQLLTHSVSWNSITQEVSMKGSQTITRVTVLPVSGLLTETLRVIVQRNHQEELPRMPTHRQKQICWERPRPSIFFPKAPWVGEMYSIMDLLQHGKTCIFPTWTAAVLLRASM